MCAHTPHSYLFLLYLQSFLYSANMYEALPQLTRCFEQLIVRTVRRPAGFQQFDPPPQESERLVVLHGRTICCAQPLQGIRLPFHVAMPLCLFMATRVYGDRFCKHSQLLERLSQVLVQDDGC